MFNDGKDELRAAVYEPTKKLIEILENRKDQLDMDELFKLEGLKANVAIWEEMKRREDKYKWKKSL